MTHATPSGRSPARPRLNEKRADRPPPRHRPRLSLDRGGALPAPTHDAAAPPATVFSPHLLVLTLEREDGPCRLLDLRSTLAVVQRWREAVLAHSNGLPDPVRTLLSGHAPDGAPIDAPHLAFLPLADVGHARAGGRLLGMALALPADTPPEDRRLALRAIERARRLKIGPLGAWTVGSTPPSPVPWNLRPRAWTAHPRGATHWSTVTPVVFDRHPKSRTRGEHRRRVAAMIATACTRIGLPPPREVVAMPVSAHLGVPPAFSFPRVRRKDGGERRHTYAILVFDEPVRGPIVIGAGRFRGYGLCRPLDEPDAGAERGNERTGDRP